MSLSELIIDIPAEYEMNVFGQFDTYIKKIERTFHVTLISRDGATKIVGDTIAAQKAQRVLTQLVELAKRGNTITEQNVDYAISLVFEDQEEALVSIDKDLICHTLQGKPIKPKTLGQKKYVDAILVVPNDKLLQVVERAVGVREAFCVTDEVLYRGIQGLSDIITIPGMINIDFADVRKVVKDSGTALMGIGRAQGEGRAVKAAEMAINSQLLESSIDGASGIIVNITGSSNMTLYEINDATSVINNVVNDDADVIIGTAINEAFQNEIQITVIATGFAEKSAQGPQLSAAEYFQGKTSSTTSQSSSSNFGFPQMQPMHLDVPDFLKKN